MPEAGRHLSVVEDPKPVEVPVLHQVLSGSGSILHTNVADGTTVHTVEFTQGLRGTELATMLAEPARSQVADFTAWDVLSGLRAQTFPDSKVTRGVRVLGRHARLTLSGMRADLRDMVRTLSHDLEGEKIATNTSLYDDWNAEIYIRDVLGSMKPRVIGELCKKAGLQVDEVRLLRLKGGLRGTKVINIHDVGVDENRLRLALLEEHFTSKVYREMGEDREVFMPRADLPQASWVQHMRFIERVRRLPDLPDDLGQRWRIHIWDESAPSHVVVPRLAWLCTRAQPSSQDTKTPPLRLQSGRYNRTYEPVTHRVVHRSALLGALLLANAVEADQLAQQHAKLVRAVHTAGRYGMPRKAVGYGPAALTGVSIDPYDKTVQQLEAVMHS